MGTRRSAGCRASRKVLLMLAIAAQISLAVSAWTDLAKRPARQVNGPKPAWAAVIAVNFVGPLLYFWRGRRSQPADTTPSTPPPTAATT